MLADIPLGNILYVLAFSACAIAFGIAAWPQSKPPSYKDVLSGGLGICFEALGAEMTRGQISMVAPLAIGMLLAALIRYLPDTLTTNKYLKGTILIGLYIIFIFIPATLLLLSLNGRLDKLIVYPNPFPYPNTPYQPYHP